MSKTRPFGSGASRGASAVRVARFVVVVGAPLAVVSGCLERPLCAEDCSPKTTNLFVESADQTSVDKIDLLFMIDNSVSMGDKQKVLAAAVPDLVGRLVNPVCVDKDGDRGPDAVPGADCAAGFHREFHPVRDIHVGVVTSSLGGHGGKFCSQSDPARETPRALEEADDQAHLVATRPRFAEYLAATPPPVAPPHPEFGYLEWNPDLHPEVTIEAFTSTFTAMTRAADEQGCGYEASLESVYRFLSDPSPPARVTTGPCPGSPGATCAFPEGRDDVLLAERRSFLRPDSLVAVVLLSDENDCSVRDGGQAYLVAEPGQPMFRGSAACAANPNDRCCYSCGQTPPDGCAPDPACGTLARELDPPNLRCFRQKERFGYDFLYPTRRYVNALSRNRLCPARADLDPEACPDGDGDGAPDLVPNPLYYGDPAQPSPAPRDPSLVFLAGVVGVPWQDIAVDPAATTLHFQSAKELARRGTWSTLLGVADPGSGAPPVAPTDALMTESIDPRSGASPVGPLVSPSGGPLANAANGHEWANQKRADLQYACIFELPEPMPLEACTSTSCDCADPLPGDHKPLCQAADGSYGTTQYYAKAYPGLRELEVLRGVGDQGIVASICARELHEDRKTSQDYGFRPAVDALVDRLKGALAAPCLPRPLEVTNGTVPCRIIEATSGGVCDPARGRVTPSPSIVSLSRSRLHDRGDCDTGLPASPSCDDFTLCEIQEAGPDCHQSDVEPTSVGWCYVDPEQNPGVDSPDLVGECPLERRRILRFVDPKGQTPASGAKVLIACFGAPLGEGTSAP